MSVSEVPSFSYPLVAVGNTGQPVGVSDARSVRRQRLAHLGRTANAQCAGGRAVRGAPGTAGPAGPAAPGPATSPKPRRQHPPVRRAERARLRAGPVLQRQDRHRTRPGRLHRQLPQVLATVYSPCIGHRSAVTVSAWSLMFCGEIVTSALNAIRNVNALDPSWLAGMSCSVAVRGSASVAFDVFVPDVVFKIRNRPPATAPIRAAAHPDIVARARLQTLHHRLQVRRLLAAFWIRSPRSLPTSSASPGRSPSSAP